MARLAGVEELNCEPTDHCRGPNLGRGRRGSYGRAALAARPIAVAMTRQSGNNNCAIFAKLPELVSRPRIIN
jgi:hypothetical protein